MIAFLLKQNIELFLTDYLSRVCKYLKDLNIDADVIKYTPGRGYQIPEKYTTIIFVQTIDSSIMNQFTHISKQALPNPARRATPAFGVRRLNIKTPSIFISQDPMPETVSTEKTRRVLILNTEQATVDRYTTRLVADVRRYNVPVVDYSIENISLLQQCLPHTIFIHFPFPPTFGQPQPKQHDVISLISSQHRRQVCNSLGVPVVNFSGKWGVARDTLISKSKILVNLHHQPREYRIFESIRCYHALELGTLVVSDYSVNINLLPLKDMIIFCHPNDMKVKVKNILENYDKIYSQIFSEKNISSVNEKIQSIYKQNVEKLLTLQNNY